MPKPTRQTLFRKLAALYGRMADAYAGSAGEIGLSCAGCEKNCCTSYFQHHTYIEWAYLWQGLRVLDEARREDYLGRARAYVRESQAALVRGEAPSTMCPLNDDGPCGVYAHRLMICRMHGVPNRIVRPDGRAIAFPGCFKSQALTAERREQGRETPVLDRTPLYTELVRLEMDLLGNKARSLPRVDLTLAEMLVMGPPQV